MKNHLKKTFYIPKLVNFYNYNFIKNKVYVCMCIKIVKINSGQLRPTVTCTTIPIFNVFESFKIFTRFSRFQAHNISDVFHRN